MRNAGLRVAAALEGAPGTLNGFVARSHEVETYARDTCRWRQPYTAESAEGQPAVRGEFVQQGGRRFLMTLLGVSAIALGQPEAACPEFPSDDRAHGGETFTLGDWTLIAGAWLATCADGGALWVACSDEGDALTIRMLFPALDAARYSASFGVAGTAVLTTDPLVSDDGSLTLGEADTERLIPLLAAGGELRVALTPATAATTTRDLVFATAGFEEALPWLGCSDADACPARSCGP